MRIFDWKSHKLYIEHSFLTTLIVDIFKYRRIYFETESIFDFNDTFYFAWQLKFDAHFSSFYTCFFKYTNP